MIIDGSNGSSNGSNNDDDDDEDAAAADSLEELQDYMEQLSELTDNIKSQAHRLRKVRPEMAGREIGETIMPMLDELSSLTHDMFATILDLITEDEDEDEEVTEGPLSSIGNLSSVLSTIATTGGPVILHDPSTQAQNQPEPETNGAHEEDLSDGVPSDGAP